MLNILFQLRKENLNIFFGSRSDCVEFSSVQTPIYIELTSWRKSHSVVYIIIMDIIYIFFAKKSRKLTAQQRSAILRNFDQSIFRK